MNKIIAYFIFGGVMFSVFGFVMANAYYTETNIKMIVINTIFLGCIILILAFLLSSMNNKESKE